jgi:hypothetical protein
MPAPVFLTAVALTVVALILLWLANDTQFDEQGDATIMQYSQAIIDLGNAIAGAEGFGKPGDIPTNAHNPGDLVIPNWKGATLGAEKISVFASDDEGWARLRHQLQLIVDGKSHVYNLDMTILQMANKWTRTDPAVWANNVATAIGVTVAVTLRAILT